MSLYPIGEDLKAAYSEACNILWAAMPECDGPQKESCFELAAKKIQELTRENAELREKQQQADSELRTLREIIESESDYISMRIAQGMEHAIKWATGSKIRPPSKELVLLSEFLRRETEIEQP